MSTRQPFPTELSIPLPSFPNDDRDRDGTKTPRTPADEALSYFSSPLSPSSLSNPIQVFELPLEPDGGPSKERSYIRLPPAYTPYILRVILEAGTPASRNAVFRTNFPLDGGMFEREKFCERKLPTDFSKPIQVDLPISHAGAFLYWVDYDSPSPSSPSSLPQRIQGRKGYFNIDPVLRIPARLPLLPSSHSSSSSSSSHSSSSSSPSPESSLTSSSPSSHPSSTSSSSHPSSSSSSSTSQPGFSNPSIKRGEYVNLPLDGLAILTVVSKWMGPLAEWRKHFAEASRRGYTMLHYTPLQERGESDSPYSIRDQLRYDPSLFAASPGASASGDGVGKGNVGEVGVGEDGGKEEIEKVLKEAREEFGLLALTDVVLNHTANDSPWLVEHPEAGYSPANTPHLAPALELDTLLTQKFSDAAYLSSSNLPTSVTSEADLDAIMKAVESEVRKLDLWQYYVLDVQREKDGVLGVLKEGKVGVWEGEGVVGKSVVELATLLKASGKIEGLATYSARFAARADPALAASLVSTAFSHLDKPEELAEAWGRVVDVLNVDLYKEWEEDTRVAVEGVRGRVKYTRLDGGGPRLGPISKDAPLVEPYFTRLPGSEKDPSKYSLANNGWIWASDPLQNFALLPSKAYLRREVIVWGDCVKLNYGPSPPTSPSSPYHFLWSHMEKYVTELAGTFQGFRLDNAHSTPLWVGAYMLDASRRANPDLYVCAELFTGSEEMDLEFVRALGVGSLVREVGNAGDPREESRLLYRYGLGKPLGSMDAAALTREEDLPPPPGIKGPVRPAVVTTLQGNPPHALLYDQTHDNESNVGKRSAEDNLASAGVVAFSVGAAVGSVKGFDDLHPRLLNLVGEKRVYEVEGEGPEEEKKVKGGIGRAKGVLNGLRREMVLGAYVEGHVHQENDYIILHRVHPGTQKGYLLVAHTAFPHTRGSKDRGYVDPIKLRRTKAKFLYGASLLVHSSEDRSDEKTIRGLDSELVEMAPGSIVVPQGLDGEGPYAEIVVPEKFPPGSIMVFETSMPEFDVSLDRFCVSGAPEAFSSLDLVDLNVVLFRADGEERDATGGEIGAYEVPGLGGANVYCGLEGFMHPLRHVMRWNDLGHPVCAHLREGAWAMDYIVGRLEKAARDQGLGGLEVPARWFKERFDRVKESVPPFLRPKYFALVVSEAYKAARAAVVEQCSGFVSGGHGFTQDLALCSVQMHGLVRSASLDPDPGKITPSLAAGLPHFAAGWARCWGRDVFISLRGLFLTTGNFEGAKRHIVAFASTLKHGLIPNLLDSVRSPRYNSRDSPWWMAQNIQDYVKAAPDGLALLDERVKRRFTKDDSWVAWDDPRAYAYESTVAEIVQEILQRHADGIKFREYNAGPNLDMQMSEHGFDIEVGVDWETGLVRGGNEANCGTWMDKMGESVKAGTKGKPGTPRDGADVEIVGLVYSTLRWLDGLSKKGKFPFGGVEKNVGGERKVVTYGEWAGLIEKSFEKCFYVPLDPSEDSKYNLDPKLVNRRGIYKDVYGSGSGREWSDYQLRCNFPIAMAVAPELFDPPHALGALKLADEVLRSPLGMKTLDPIDLQYRPHYDNSNDSTDAAIAKGLNYHNGPEWGWPLGYFLRAYLHFDLVAGKGQEDPTETLHHLLGILLPSRRHIRSDPWAGLPELTNENGAYCYDSCATQAWSASTLLDFLEDVHHLAEKK